MVTSLQARVEEISLDRDDLGAALALLHRLKTPGTKTDEPAEK
jgi:hypothetical protein